VSTTGHEPDKLWSLIDEQKRAALWPSRSEAQSEMYSHDPKQAWVQALFGAVRSERRRAVGRGAARRVLRAAIRRSARTGYPHAAPGSAPALRRALSVHSPGAFVLLSLLVGFLLLFLCRCLH
jgi:hypothetical protein